MPAGSHGGTASAQLCHLLHSVCMKRTNLVLDEQLLEEAVRISGERTYSRAVERALHDFVQRARARRILELTGSGLWDGNLSTVREDRATYRSRRRGAR
jgi:Arc/MetJ family transcription regulator